MVEDISVQRLCRQQPITAVNGTLQGPTINAREGEWWNANVVEVEHNATESQTAPIPSAAYTINGLPGYFCNCSESRKPLSIDNSTLQYIIKSSTNNLAHLSFKSLSRPYHTFTMVAIDALYTQHYKIDVVVLAPGQTVDVLFSINQPPSIVFDYTDPNITGTIDNAFKIAPTSTKVKTLKFNSTIEIVFQSTTIVSAKNHPIHIHGFNFHVLAQGFGN
ncbi:hypothetical protein JHK86_001282 [Glycine max]|nr:hypothetical protein JHK86_001282 [Glycine max]